MEPPPLSHQLSGMIPVARFYNCEEAVELSALAAEVGVLAVVAANLTEWVVAEKLLASRGPDEDP